jgi:hypothetical protein
VIDGHVSESWSRVGDSLSSPTLLVTAGEKIYPLDAEVVDPHPEELRDAATGEPKDDYRLSAGTRVVALAEPRPDGTYGRPAHGPRLFAAGRAADIQANARRAELQMRRNALIAGGAGIVLLVLGLLLR